MTEFLVDVDKCPCLDCKTRRGEFDAGRFKATDAPNATTGGQDFDIAQAKGAVAKAEADALKPIGPRALGKTTFAEDAYVRDEAARKGRPGGWTYERGLESDGTVAYDVVPETGKLEVSFNPTKGVGGLSSKEIIAKNALLSTDAALRKEVPIATCVIDYFPLALAAVAAVSRTGQLQHGTTDWDRSKSSDESDALMRHFVERGTRDVDGHRHSAKVAWRALALLQKELEADRE